jgi:Uma2 family endonuclease
MATPQSKLYFTEDQYLAIERSSEERCEFLDGQIYAMAGESQEHGTICTNLTGLFFNQLRNTPCQVWSKDTKVRSGPLPKHKLNTKGLYSYPDLVVACAEREYLDEHHDVLLNPRVIIEVLSPATEAFDRGEKFMRYKTWLPMLSDYLLVSQSSPVITHHVKRDDGGWSLYFYEGLEQSLFVQSINCTLKLADVYDRIQFPAVLDGNES